MIKSTSEELRELDTTDLRTNSAIYKNNIITLGFNNACSPDGLSIHSCIRIDRIDTKSNYSLTEKNIGVLNSDLFYPAFAVSDRGNFTFAAAMSSPEIYPSLIVGDDTFTNIGYLTSGSNSNNSSRFGDYFGFATDPVDGSAWFSGEFVTNDIKLPDTIEAKDLESIKYRVWSTYVANINPR